MGVKDVITAAVEPTVNEQPLLAATHTVTTRGPFVAPVGTATAIVVSLQFVALAAAVPLNVTVFVPCVAPKAVPVIVTAVPMKPDEGERAEILGAAIVNDQLTVDARAFPARS